MKFYEVVETGSESSGGGVAAMGEERRGAPAKRPRVEDGVTTMLVLQAAVKQAAASAEAEPAPKMPPPQSEDCKFSTGPTTLDPSSCTVTDLSFFRVMSRDS